MNNKIVIANLKLNFTKQEINEYIKNIGNPDKRFIVFPSSIYIPYFLDKSYSVGIQDVYFEDKGTFTGQVSAIQASSLGVEYTLVGHSERRHIFGETDEETNLKIKKGLEHNLKVVFCVGETRPERNEQQTEVVLDRQLGIGLKDLDNLENIIIAYEPVWAISNGNEPSLTPTNDEIKYVTEYIKNKVKEITGSNDVPVLYGGSVNDANIEEINELECLSGVLVGGASLKIEKIQKIIEVVVPQ